MEKGKHQVGYSGNDSMREKAERLFGNAVSGVDMTDVMSKSAPSRQPMRMYAAGGHVKHAGSKHPGSMMPHNAKGVVQGGELTDMHMPKKLNTKAFSKGGKACYAKGGRVRFEGEHEDHEDDVHATQAMKSHLKSMVKGTKNSAEHPKWAAKELPEVGERKGKYQADTDRKEIDATLTKWHRAEPKARTMKFNPGTDKQVGMHLPKRKMPEGFKEGGHVEKKKVNLWVEPKDKAEYKQWVRAREEAGLQSPAGHGAEEDMRRQGMGRAEQREANKRLAKHRREAEEKGEEPAYKMGGRVMQETDRGPLMRGTTAHGKKSMPTGHEHGQYVGMKKGGDVAEELRNALEHKEEQRRMKKILGEYTEKDLERRRERKAPELELYKHGGRAKVTSTMRKAVKGRSKNDDQSTHKGQVLDTGSVKQNTTPKKASMKHPKPASNGNKRSSLNLEMYKPNGFKRGGKC